jgi:hypothetical protein
VAPDIVAAAADPADPGTPALWVAHATPANEATPPSDASSVIRLVGSVDGGSSWVDTRVTPDGETGWRPSVAVTPDGLLAITWFRPDAEETARDSVSLPTAVDLAWLRPAGDGTARVVERVTLDRFGWVPRRDGSYFLGDYHGLAAANDAAVAVFSRSTANGARVVAVRVARPRGEGRP